MADITTKVTAIRAAILGEEVRESIASGIESINTEVESNTAKQDNLEVVFNDLVINAGSENAEIVLARNGEVSLPVRLGKVDTTLADNTQQLRGRINIFNWYFLVLNKGLPNEDWKDAFQAAVDYIKTQTYSQRLVFPSGIYQYSLSPNWAIQDGEIVSEGEVRFRYTGVGRAVILDGIIGTNSNVYNMKFGKFIVEAPSTSQDGFYIKCVHHSEIDMKVRGCGLGYAGFNIGFTVCNKFRITVSNNEEGWYLNARPTYGLQFSKELVGQIPSYNTFYDCIIEGTVQGGKLDDSLGNVFIGGTMEGCLDNGLMLGVTAGLNKFYGMDFEANDGVDIYCQGFENSFYGVDSTKFVNFGNTAKDNLIEGGSFKSLSFESGSLRNVYDNLKYNRQLYDGTDGTIIDSGSNVRGRCIDIKNGIPNPSPTIIFSGSWVTDTTFNNPFKIYKDTEGFVNLSGSIMTTIPADYGSGALLFTLPVGFSPLVGTSRYKLYNGASDAVITIDASTRQVRIISGTGTMLCFDGVRIKTF